MRRQDGYSQKCMAKVILKDLKKVYPNTEKKKKAKKVQAAEVSEAEAKEEQHEQAE